MLCLFAKQPLPGKVKSRLIPAIGAEGAARLAEAFLIDLLRRLQRELPELRLIVYVDPPESANYFHKLLCATGLEPFPDPCREAERISDHAAAGGPSLGRSLSPRSELRTQSTGGLGERLASALAECSNEPIIFIGADAPDLPRAEIERAISVAQEGQAYIQRAHDGGYVLLALPKNATPGVFSDIRWSASTTAAEQIARIRESGIEVVESPDVWWDIDEPSDLGLLRARLERNPSMAPETLSVLLSLTIPPTS
jgi:glycosyltransferase A (GT-A) superfamily protein (DUF2064 family)